MTFLKKDIQDWLNAPAMGPMSNQLRSAAMCAAEDGYTRKQFITACEEIGVNKGTAGNRWHEAVVAA